MKLEAVIVCVDYADFLAATLPHNLPHLDALSVVTTPADRETQALCARWGVKCLQTDVFSRDPSSRFNKSRGINHGLNHCRRDDWLLHLDADVVLPTRFRHLVANAELDPSCIYGVDRVNCPTWSEWQAFLAAPEIQFEWSYLVKPPRGWGLGARLVHQDYGGYVPIGFFQLWHSSARTRYPIMHDGDSEHTDVLHGAEWSRPKRQLLPEVLAIHLESEPAPMGANWKGRKTARFGPPPAAGPAPIAYGA